jgi:curli biogenesis system outer membrane secretion channel CsgG
MSSICHLLSGFSEIFRIAQVLAHVTLFDLYAALSRYSLGGCEMRKILAAFAMLFVFVSSPAVGQQQAVRPSVGISELDDLANTGQAATFSTMIETSVASTGRFRVIERERLGRLLQEQGRARSGVVTSRNRARVGGFEGVDYLIYGSITTVQAQARTNLLSALAGGLATGLRGQNGGNVNCTTQEATLAVDIRITDADSGEIRYAGRISETQRVAMACGSQIEINIPLLLRAAAERIAGQLVTAIYPIQIAAAQPDGTYILNYGDGTLTAGAILTVYSPGQPIRDPTTGQIIGNDETKLGHIRVSEVTGRMSRAVAAAPFATPPMVGAIVRPASEEDIRNLGRNRGNNRDRRNRREEGATAR